MNFKHRAFGWSVLPQRLRGMFNLNDPRWGRGDDKPASEGQDGSKAPGNPPGANGSPQQPSNPQPSNSGNGANRPGQSSGPPELDELWRDLNRKLAQFFGGGFGLT